MSVCLKGQIMKMLVFVTQLGLSVALPLAGFIWIALWLREQWQLGSWVIWAGIIVGMICAADGLRNTLRVMERLSRNKKTEKNGAVSFQDHE